MHEDALIDGIAADGSWLNERALQFGDGLFETIAIVDAKACLWDRHMARLAEGCRRLKLPLPDSELLSAEVQALSAGHARAVLKIYWTAGSSTRGYRRPSPLKPRRMLRLSPWPYPDPLEGWTVRECQHRLGENPALAGIKHLNRLDQVIARAEWGDPAIAEGVMLGQDGRVVCGTMSNIFIQQGEQLLTPAIDGAGVAGVVRDLALELARRTGTPLAEAPVWPDQLRKADALYLTNSLIGVVRVARFDTTGFDLARAEHPLMKRVRQECHRPTETIDRAG